MITVKSGYMSEAYAPTPKLVRDTAYNLRPYHLKYDTMVGTGLSGSLVIPRLARAMHKEWLIIRKPGDGTHSDEPGEGMHGDRWLFVDDFVSSGSTRTRVLEAVGAIVGYHRASYGTYGPPPEFVGTYEYQRDSYTEPGAGVLETYHDAINKFENEW